MVNWWATDGHCLLMVLTNVLQLLFQTLWYALERLQQQLNLLLYHSNCPAGTLHNTFNALSSKIDIEVTC
jgi:hypothetical protein